LAGGFASGIERRNEHRHDHQQDSQNNHPTEDADGFAIFDCRPEQHDADGNEQPYVAEICHANGEDGDGPRDVREAEGHRRVEARDWRQKSSHLNCLMRSLRGLGWLAAPIIIIADSSYGV
jgi:hypothetical protein